MSAENDAPTGPPHGPQQPRWAWWVVGIVVPLVGVLVTVLASSDDDSAEPPPTPTQSPAPTEPTSSATRSASAAKVRYGPVVFETDMTSGGQSVELDTTAPLPMGTLAKGEDLGVGATTGTPSLYSTGSTELTLAPLPGSGPTPTEAECAEAVERNGTYHGEAARGARFCLVTTEGRTAYLRVLSAPPGAEGKPKFEVTVWETPDA